MKKIFANLSLILLIIIISLEILIEKEEVINTVLFSFDIWKNNIFPSLFPFLVIGNILIELGFPILIGELLKKVMYKLFKINGKSSFILILSILSGFPSSAKYTKELLLNGDINEREATKILCFTHFSNPLFILGTIPIFLNNKEIALYILISHYLGNFIIGLLFRNYYVSKEDESKINIKESLIRMQKNRKYSFGQILSNSIVSSINTLLLVLGTVSIFLILTTLINNNLNMNFNFKTIINGLFEMTQGLKYLSFNNISLNIKAIISIIFISFGGLSVHMQVLTIISDTKIKYFPYFISRILHAFISVIIFLIWKIFIVI